MASKKVHTTGPVIPVSVTELKSGEVFNMVDDQTEALIQKNNQVLGVYMTVERRNELTHQVEAALFAVEMLSSGKNWDDLRRSSDQAAAGQVVSSAVARQRAREAVRGTASR
jgi:hypothetical protein